MQFKHLLRICILLLLVGLTSALILSSTLAMQAKEIREFPDRSSFLNMVSSGGLTASFSLYLLLQPGESIYHAAILPWLYGEEISISDSFLNRRILASHLLQLPEELALDYAHSYPLTPTSEVNHLLAWTLEHENYRSIVQLHKTEEGRNLLNKWVERNIFKTRPDRDKLSEVLPFVFKTNEMKIERLLDRIVVLQDLKTFGGKISQYVIARSLEEQDEHARRTLQWSKHKINNGKLSISELNTFFSALLLHPATKDDALSFLTRHRKEIPDHELLKLFYPSTSLSDLPDGSIDLIIELVQDQPTNLLQIFHSLLHQRHPAAESIAHSILQEDDSLVRKGIIVLQRRHNVNKPRYQIDDAFTGTFRRPVLFKTIYQYRDSIALKTYEELAGHTYHSVGKRFPPFTGGRIPTARTLSQWQGFIEKYPWFPGTDDAFYRLIHGCLINGRYQLASDILAKFDSQELVDEDIAPYMDALRIMVDFFEDFDIEQPPDFWATHRQIRETMNQLPWLPWGEKRARAMKLEHEALLLDWALSFDKLIVVGVDRRKIENARIELDFAREKCSGSWFRECNVPRTVDLINKSVWDR